MQAPALKAGQRQGLWLCAGHYLEAGGNRELEALDSLGMARLANHRR